MTAYRLVCYPKENSVAILFADGGLLKVCTREDAWKFIREAGVNRFAKHDLEDLAKYSGVSAW